MIFYITAESLIVADFCKLHHGPGTQAFGIYNQYLISHIPSFVTLHSCYCQSLKIRKFPLEVMHKSYCYILFTSSPVKTQPHCITVKLNHIQSC